MIESLKFIVVYRLDGLPIYSKCFSDFCSDIFGDSALLTGFLSAIENTPQNIDESSPLRSIKIGKTLMKFNKTSPSGHSVVIGMTSENEDLFKDLFQGISILLEGKYSDRDWSIIEKKFTDEFEKSMIKNAIMPTFHGLSNYHNECRLGTDCPLNVIEHSHQDKPIWAILEETFVSCFEKRGIKYRGSKLFFKYT